MRRTRIVLGALFVGLLLLGCAAPPYGSSHERAWTGRHAQSGVRTPVWAPNYDIVVAVESPLMATSSESEWSRMGKGHCTSILLLVAWGDASLETITRDAGISTIHHVDVESTSVLFGLYSRYQVTVYGD